MKPGPMPKDKDRKQGRYKAPTVEPVRSAPLALDKYPPRADWHPAISFEWANFWQTNVALAVAESDIPALYRLFDLRSLAFDFMSEAKSSPTVLGSQGQEVLNPLLRQVDTYNAEIRQLEDRFGLNPAARTKLGLSASQLKRSLADTAKEALEHDTDIDPRTL